MSAVGIAGGTADVQVSDLISHYCLTLLRIAGDRGITLRSLPGSASGQSPESLVDFDFTPEHHAGLLAELTEALGDEFIGSAAYRCKPGTYQQIFEILTRCETLGDAIEQCFAIYAMITDDIQFLLHRNGQLAVVETRVSGDDTDRYFYTRESMNRGFHRLFSALISQNIPLHEVRFTHAAAVPVIEYTRVFHCPCFFEQSQQFFSFDAQWLTHRVRINQNRWHIIWQGTRDRVDCVSLPETGSIAELIEKEAATIFLNRQQFPTLEELAANHHKSVQTLRRVLKADGLSYSEIKEKIRRDVVLRWIQNESVSLAEVAEIGGFAEATGLSRAFKQWFGVSPSAYRKDYFDKR